MAVDIRGNAPELTAYALKAVPSVGAIGAWLSGVSMQSVTAFFAMVFIVLQTAHLTWKWRYEAKLRKESRSP